MFAMIYAFFVLALIFFVVLYGMYWMVAKYYQTTSYKEADFFDGYAGENAIYE